MPHADGRATWQRLLAEQQASGLSMAAWCVQQDIRPQTFAYWRKRLAEPAPTALRNPTKMIAKSHAK